MSTPRRRSCTALLFAGLLSTAGGAHAGFVVSEFLQGPKVPLVDNPAPPPLVPQMVSTIAAFNSGVNILGGNEFEGGPGNSPPSVDFNYTGGRATAGGAFSLIDGAVPDPALGRYNTTTGLPTTGGLIDPGHWLESTGGFSYSLTGKGLSAFSFFATDVGDFDLGITLTLLRDGSNVFTNNLTFNASTSNNGNLLFVGIKGDSSADTFDQILVTINQAVGAPSLDAVGFDSIRVGVVTGSTGGGEVPEPGSLALTGLALATAALVARRRKAA